jgi:hypothetical protein
LLFVCALVNLMLSTTLYFIHFGEGLLKYGTIDCMMRNRISGLWDA